MGTMPTGFAGSVSNAFGLFGSLSVPYQWLAIGIATFVLWSVKGHYEDKKKWGHIPIVGSTPLTRWFAPVKYLVYGNRMILEGYKQHKPGLFRIKQFGKWNIFVTTPKALDELRRFPDEVLSSRDAINEDLEIEWTIGKPIAESPWHIANIRENLTRSLGFIFPIVHEEMVMAFEHYIPATSSDWTPLKMATFFKIVCRMTNRAIVGPALCRNEDYLDINIKFTIDVFLGAQILKIFPTWLKPFARRYVTTVDKRIRRGAEHLLPIIEERIELIESQGRGSSEIPEDFLTWIILTAPPSTPLLEIAHRILSVNVAAIHTTSLSFTNVLYHLAAYGEEYAGPMREEARDSIRRDGWSKVAMTNCRKIDSFVKEVFRMRPLGSISMLRKTLSPITLSDGAHIPRGAFVSSPTIPIQLDRDIYGPTAGEFDGFRFSNIREEEEEELLKHQAVTLKPEFLVWGLGKHACPGRFFAVNEVKALLAHVLINYEVKFDPSLGLKKGELPKGVEFANATAPDGNVVVMFRRRGDEEMQGA